MCLMCSKVFETLENLDYSKNSDLDHPFFVLYKALEPLCDNNLRWRLQSLMIIINFYIKTDLEKYGHFLHPFCELHHSLVLLQGELVRLVEKNLGYQLPRPLYNNEGHYEERDKVWQIFHEWANGILIEKLKAKQRSHESVD